MREARCVFGFSEEDVGAGDARRRARADAGADAMLDRLGEGGVALLSGPSGGGKSSMLDAIEHRAKERASVVVRARASRGRSGRTPVSLVGGSVDDAIAILASAGLGDARAMTTPAAALSDGEAFRLSLARAMGEAMRRGRTTESHRVSRSGRLGRTDSSHATCACPIFASVALRGPPCFSSSARRSSPIVLVDEFCSTLDGVTAMGVARTFSRWVRREGVRAVVATARDEMIEWLSPELVCWLGLDSDPVLAWRGVDGRVRAGGAAGAGVGFSTGDRDRARVA